MLVFRSSHLLKPFFSFSQQGITWVSLTISFLLKNSSFFFFYHCNKRKHTFLPPVYDYKNLFFKYKYWIWFFELSCMHRSTYMRLVSTEMLVYYSDLSHEVFIKDKVQWKTSLWKTLKMVKKTRVLISDLWLLIIWLWECFNFFQYHFLSSVKWVTYCKHEHINW